MRGISLIFLFTSLVVMADESGCGDDFPVFKSPPPPPFVKRETDGSISVFTKYTHEGLDLHWMVLEVYSEKKSELGEIRVPLAFWKEGEFGVSSIGLNLENENINFFLSAKYTDHNCGPSVAIDFEA